MCNLKVILYTVHPAAKELVIMEPTVVKHTRQLNQSYMGTSARYQPNTSAQLAKCLQTISKNLALSQSEIPTHYNTDTVSHCHRRRRPHQPGSPLVYTAEFLCVPRPARTRPSMTRTELNKTEM